VRLNSTLFLPTVAIVCLVSCASTAAPAPPAADPKDAPEKVAPRPAARVVWTAPAGTGPSSGKRCGAWTSGCKQPELSELIGTSPDARIAWVDVFRGQGSDLDTFEIDVSAGTAKVVWSAARGDYGPRPFGWPREALIAGSGSHKRYWAMRNRLVLAGRRDQKAEAHPFDPALKLWWGDSGVFVIDRTKDLAFRVDPDMDAGRWPAFSPDGVWIAWQGLALNDSDDLGAVYRTYLRTTKGTTVHRTALAHTSRQLLWSADGSYIYATTVNPRICLERVKHGQWNRPETLACLSEHAGGPGEKGMVVAGDATSIALADETRTKGPPDQRTLSVVWVSTVTGETLANRELAGAVGLDVLRSDGLAIVRMRDDGFAIANLRTGEVQDAPMLDGASWVNLRRSVWRTDRPLVFARWREKGVELVSFDVDLFLGH
jgi:hypothetical protein